MNFNVRNVQRQRRSEKCLKIIVKKIMNDVIKLTDIKQRTDLDVDPTVSKNVSNSSSSVSYFCSVQWRCLQREIIAKKRFCNFVAWLAKLTCYDPTRVQTKNKQGYFWKMIYYMHSERRNLPSIKTLLKKVYFLEFTMAICEPRAVFRTHSNIYDGAFLWK